MERDYSKESYSTVRQKIQHEEILIKHWYTNKCHNIDVKDYTERMNIHFLPQGIKEVRTAQIQKITHQSILILNKEREFKYLKLQEEYKRAGDSSVEVYNQKKARIINEVSIELSKMFDEMTHLIKKLIIQRDEEIKELEESIEEDIPEIKNKVDDILVEDTVNHKEGVQEFRMRMLKQIDSSEIPISNDEFDPSSLIGFRNNNQESITQKLEISIEQLTEYDAQTNQIDLNINRFSYDHQDEWDSQILRNLEGVQIIEEEHLNDFIEYKVFSSDLE